MQIWLLKDGEHLPVQAGARPLRMGMLARELVKREHTVTWWSSTFSHQRKTLLYARDIAIAVEPRYTLKLIHAGKYTGNISLRRYRHHRRVARGFAQQVETMPRPDVIVSAFPTIDLSYEACRYAQAWRIPFIVDIRDLWPDIFLEKCPRFLRTLAKTMLRKDFWKTQYLLSHATSLVAISSGCLNWGLRCADRPRNSDDRVFYTGYPSEDECERDVSERIQCLERTFAGKIVFTFVGSFGYSYELALVCSAACELAKLGKDNIHFVLAGDGLQFEAVARRARSLPNLTVTGWLDKYDLSALIKRSHVGLVPCCSVPHAMPNKPFEYWSAGLPIISSLEGEMVKVVAAHDVGLSYKCGDLKGLLRNVLTLAEDRELRKRQAKNARELFVRQFDAALIYNDYAAHVEKMSGRHNTVHRVETCESIQPNNRRKCSSNCIQ